MEKKLNPRCCLCGDMLPIASFDVSSPHMCCDCLSKTLYSDHKVPEMTKQSMDELSCKYELNVENEALYLYSREQLREAFLAGAKEGAKREREKWEEKILEVIQCGGCTMEDFIEE